MNKEIKCKTCEDTKKIRKNEPYCLISREMDDYWFKFCKTDEAKDECAECPEHKNNKHLIEYIPCPDCQQPSASDFTNNLRNFVKLYENEIPRRAEITFLQEACKRLDSETEISLKSLEACTLANMENMKLQARLDSVVAACEIGLYIAEWISKLSNRPKPLADDIETIKAAIALTKSKSKRDGINPPLLSAIPPLS